MKINADKCHLLVSTNNTVRIKILNFYKTNSKSEKLLGVKFYRKLSFDDHISELCKKTSKNINALSRVALYMNISKRHILVDAFFKSQFSYCPFVWIGCVIVVLTMGKKLTTRALLANNIFQQTVIVWNAVGKRWLCFCSESKSSDPCN